MALSRSELKSVIKELLVEILSEGLGHVQAPSQGRPTNRSPSLVGEARRRPPPPPSKRAFDPRLDTPVRGARSVPDAMTETIKRESGGNPLMANILADTAATTLPTMLENETAGGGSGGRQPPREPPREQFNGAPEEVFGEETSGRWADLAFAVPKKLA